MLPLLALLCLHTRTTTSSAHQPCGAACCNHDETCDDCGRRVGTESWNLLLGATAHAHRYEVAA